MFLRLGVLAAAFGHPACALLQLETLSSTLNTGFRTIAEARLGLFNVLAESNSFTLASNVWRNTLFEVRQWRSDGSHHARLAEKQSELDSLFADLQKRHDEHAEQLCRWREAFECKCINSKPGGASCLLRSRQIKALGLTHLSQP